MMYWRLINHLAEVDCDEVVVPLVRRQNLVQHLFTLEKDSATQSRANVHDSFNTRSFWVQAKHAFLCIWQRIYFVKVVV